MVWHHLQYVLGLARLGHNVLFLEDSDDYPGCYNPNTNEVSNDPAYGLRFIDRCFKQTDLAGRWAYFDAHTNKWFGKPKKKVFEFISSADLLLNLSGVNPLREWLLPIPIRAFVDTDPAFVQIRHLTDENARKLAAAHNAFFTFGENFGAEDCLIPDDGFPWQPTRQPVVLDAWKVTPGNKNANWTTVMQWDSYRAVEYNGHRFEMKSKSFEPYFDLPTATNEKFELAIGSATAPRELLREKGWKVTNPLVPTQTPWLYQKFIQSSKAEWSIAKHGYAASRSGWFSERSAAYLASGRPVLTQETGFSRFIESGNGLLSFSSKEEALLGIKLINDDYDKHCKIALEIAAAHFNYKKILNELLYNMLN